MTMTAVVSLPWFCGVRWENRRTVGKHRWGRCARSRTGNIRHCFSTMGWTCPCDSASSSSDPTDIRWTTGTYELLLVFSHIPTSISLAHGSFMNAFPLHLQHFPLPPNPPQL